MGALNASFRVQEALGSKILNICAQYCCRVACSWKLFAVLFPARLDCQFRKRRMEGTLHLSGHGSSHPPRKTGTIYSLSTVVVAALNILSLRNYHWLLHSIVACANPICRVTNIWQAAGNPLRPAGGLSVDHFFSTPSFGPWINCLDWQVIHLRHIYSLVIPGLLCSCVLLHFFSYFQVPFFPIICPLPPPSLPCRDSNLVKPCG